MRERLRALLRVLPEYPLSIFLLAALVIGIAAALIAMSGME
jgi:hypothetical protein